MVRVLASVAVSALLPAVAGTSSGHLQRVTTHTHTGSLSTIGPGGMALAALVPQLAPELHPNSSRVTGNATADLLPVPAPRTQLDRRTHAFLKAFFVVSVAELFDKTWFMSLILALKLGWRTALVGGYSGLLLHCVLSALLGFGFSKLLRPSVLDFITAGLFFLFTLLYAKDTYTAEPDSDLIASGKEEAAEAMGKDEAVPATGNAIRRGSKGQTSSRSSWQRALGQSFLAVFVAEWGDRTQMAMIGLHSSLPVLPVFVGSALAFLALTVSAVLVASFIATAKLSERLVMGVASVSFLVFAILALFDGLRAKQRGE